LRCAGVHRAIIADRRRDLEGAAAVGRIGAGLGLVLGLSSYRLHAAGRLAQKLLAVVSDPVDVAGTTVRVHASIGVSLYPNDGANPRALLRPADAAMYRAKTGGKNAVSHGMAGATWPGDPA
jgi:diguanylate cyclase (GGDEF)-like protein